MTPSLARNDTLHVADGNPVGLRKILDRRTGLKKPSYLSYFVIIQLCCICVFTFSGTDVEGHEIEVSPLLSVANFADSTRGNPELSGGVGNALAAPNFLVGLSSGFIGELGVPIVFPADYKADFFKSQVCPVDTASNRIYCFLGYFELFGHGGYFVPVFYSLMYLPDLRFRELSRSAIFSLGRVGSPLGMHVSHVVGGSPKEEMLGVATPRVVTFVQDKQPVQNIPMCKSPSHSMGKPFYFSANVSISVVSDGSSPFPASIFSFIHTGPEYLIGAGKMVGIDTSLGATCPFHNEFGLAAMLLLICPSVGENIPVAIPESWNVGRPYDTFALVDSILLKSVFGVHDFYIERSLRGVN